MKIRILIILTAISILNLFCSSLQIDELNAKEELRRAADSIKKDKQNIYRLDSRIVGEKGYFYILTNSGKISYHPKKALINSDFSDNTFIQKILKDRNGCLSFNVDGIRNYLFYTEIDQGEILCLAMDELEFNGTVSECN